MTIPKDKAERDAIVDRWNEEKNRIFIYFVVGMVVILILQVLSRRFSWPDKRFSIYFDLIEGAAGVILSIMMTLANRCPFCKSFRLDQLMTEKGAPDSKRCNSCQAYFGK